MKRPLIGLLFLPVLAGCGGSPAENGAGATAQSAPQTVSVVKVESRTLNTTLPLPAQITPYETVDVYPKVTGFLEKINVDRGSHVHAGEVIVELSAPELRAQRAQAEAALENAQAQHSVAQAKFAADNGTYQHLAAAAKTPGVVAGNDLLVAEKSAAAGSAQVEAAAKAVQAARDNLRSVSELESYLQLRAPFDGVVTQRNLHPGALAGPASGAAGTQPILRIESVNRLRVTVPVPEAYVSGVRDGQAVPFNVPAYPGKTFRAPIARISHDITPSTRTMQVELDFQNANGDVTPGSFATVDWPVQRKDATLFVPASAIATDLQRTFVIRLRDGKADWVDVTTGVTADGQTEIFGALQPGDLVVANATDSLRPGAPVTAREK
jgi:membrane fusion protein (multidrug efflux system)